MRVSGNDSVEPGRPGIELDLFKIVQNIKRPPAYYDEFGFGIVLRPLACIYVASYGCGRGNPSQSFDHFQRANIPSVDGRPLRAA